MASKLNQNDEKPYFNRAGAYAALGNFKMALKDLDNALKIKPDYTQAYFMRGKIKLTNGKDGCSDLKKALELGYTPAQPEIEKYCNKK
jgi:tetratricopeptide (TPR) repeat protein